MDYLDKGEMLTNIIVLCAYGTFLEYLFQYMKYGTYTLHFYIFVQYIPILTIRRGLQLPIAHSLFELETPSDFKNRKGLGLMHLNIRSLLPKLDFVNI